MKVLLVIFVAAVFLSLLGIAMDFSRFVVDYSVGGQDYARSSALSVMLDVMIVGVATGLLLVAAGAVLGEKEEE